METCKAFHYPGWSAWEAESVIVRAELVAHELVQGMRQAYNMEQRMKLDSGGSKGSGKAPWEAIREKFFR